MSSQPVFNAKFVLARKYRYSPAGSHAGDMASDMPSVTWCDRPVASEWTNTAWNWLSSRLAYASHFESGDQTGSTVRSGTMYVSVSTLVRRPLPTSTVQRFRSASVKAMLDASGDQTGV